MSAFSRKPTLIQFTFSDAYQLETMINVLELGSLDQEGSAGQDKEDDFIFNSDINIGFFNYYSSSGTSGKVKGIDRINLLWDMIPLFISPIFAFL